MVDGVTKCCHCLKGKKGCKYLSQEEEEDVEEAPALLKLLVTKLKKILSSPICSLRKRKEDQLSPKLQKEKKATSSAAI